MQIANTTLGVSFDVPEKPTVRQQLRYWSHVAFTDRGDMYEKYWNAAVSLIDADSWKCKGLALADDLNKLDCPKAVQLIQYVGLAVFSHINTLDKTDPN